jgi:hypothetical protein
MLHLASNRQRQPPEKRHRYRDDVLADRVGGHSARVGDHDGAGDHLGVEHAADPRGRAVDPAEGGGRGEMAAIDLPGKDDLGVSDERERLGFCRRVQQRVLWKGAAEAFDVRPRDVPDGERTVDGDEDLHARYSPLLPPRFSISRISPMTIALSTALIMS